MVVVVVSEVLAVSVHRYHFIKVVQSIVLHAILIPIHFKIKTSFNLFLIVVTQRRSLFSLLNKLVLILIHL